MRQAEAPVPRAEPPDGRRQQLIETTIDMLAEAGYVGTTLGRIGAGAGVSAGLVAHYFGDKDTLLDMAFRTLVERVRSRVLERLAVAQSPRERVQAVIDANLAPNAFEPRVAAAWLAVWGQVLHAPRLKRVQPRSRRACCPTCAMPCGWCCRATRPGGSPAWSRP